MYAIMGITYNEFEYSNDFLYAFCSTGTTGHSIQCNANESPFQFWSPKICVCCLVWLKGSMMYYLSYKINLCRIPGHGTQGQCGFVRNLINVINQPRTLYYAPIFRTYLNLSNSIHFPIFNSSVGLKPCIRRLPQCALCLVWSNIYTNLTLMW